MPSEAITREDRSRPSGEGAQGNRVEAAPSIMREDDPGVARAIGMIAAALVIFGGMILLLRTWGRTTQVSAGWATVWLTIGLAGLLFHAAYDRDIQFRRLYMGFGVGLLIVGLFLFIVPYPNRAGDQFAMGSLCVLLALGFLLAFLRNEDDQGLRNLLQLVLGGVGAALALIGLLGSNFNVAFLTPYGAVLPLLGLAYLAAFVGTRGTSDDSAYLGGLGIGVAGLVVFSVALGRSLLPVVLHGLGWMKTPPGDYHVQAGILLMAYGMLYMLVSAFMCSDRPVIVLARRELGSFFYSPIAYIVLFAFTVAHWLAYVMWMSRLLVQRPAIEPIVSGFILQWVAIFTIIFVVPALTMRLLSEEKRSGTLEVLLTTPVNEAGLVLAKFLAGFLMFLIVWVPFGLFLVALRLMGGQPFDYQPLLSFSVGLFVTGAAFISIGLLFSSMTRNQITSGVLTFAVMLTFTLIYLIKVIVFQGAPASSAWVVLLQHMSYIDVWINTLEGKLVLKSLVFPITMTIFCLFLTTRILEARKWQ